MFGGGAHALTPAAVFAPALSPTPANFAVPLVAAAFIFGVWSVRRPGWRKTILSAAAFGVAVVFWKGAWTLFFFWGVAELIRLAAGGKITSAHKRLWLALNSAALAALAAVSMTRGISLFDVVAANPFILTGPAVLAAHWVPAKLAPSAPPLKTLLIFSVFVILWSLVAVSADSTAYFGDATRLLSVKASFFNVKPSDPALLAFSDRLLWNYAARSADVYAVRLFFPVVFVFSAIAVLSAAVSQRLRFRLAKWCFLVHPIPVMALAAFAAFLFFEDWHSVAAFFTSVFAGCALFFWLRNAKLLRRREGLAVLAAMLIGLTLCAFAQLGEPFSSGNILISTIISLQFLGVAAASAIITAAVVKLVSKIPIAKTFARLFIVASVITIIVVELQVQLRTPPYRVQNPETAVLLDWMSKENVVNTKFSCPPALAPLIETYAGARTLPPSRPWKSLESAEKYRKLLNLTYSGTEGELAELLAENKVEYLVFDLAAALSKSLFGPRYLAEAVDIPTLCPVTLMSSSQKRRKLKRFFEIRPPQESELSLKRFVVFKVVSRRNRSDAIKWALESERFAREGNTFMAARLAKSAIFADPNCDIADIMYRKLYGTPPLIRLRGF
ncbi:MAG: hypothetical protein GXP32_06600 [Kiritimatiellaeota bacterium]|nr:hypothetical protein [Kiritimatiellota bacterium]